MKSDRTGPASSNNARNAAGLLILCFFLGIFLLQWSIEKLILPSSAVRISQGFYNILLPQSAPYFLGAAELVLSLALLFGVLRTASYGLALVIHTVTVIVSWRQLSDPYGLAKIGNHLWIATWPTFGGFVALFLMRYSDIYTFDGWRTRTQGEA
jgi:putative oxidoreductase